jgi:hypothetical protein
LKPVIVAAAFCGLAFASLVHQAAAQDALAPPSGSNLLLEADAAGVQVYICSETDKGFAWAFDGPAASLFNAEGREIGTHGKGPMWTLADGSAITAQPIAEKAAPQRRSIPWLLLKVKTHFGKYGALSKVDFVRRADTNGGAAPREGCDREHQGDIVRMRYTALYQFYGP